MAVIIDIATHERFNPEPCPPILCPVCGWHEMMAKVTVQTDFTLQEISELGTCVQCGHSFNLREVLGNAHVRDE